jgi:hypothetical protein
MTIDTTLDFSKDTPGYPKRDPDKVNLRLREYHRLLWSKPLPSGRVFTLDASVRGHYLFHDSGAERFSLASDSAIPTYTRWGFAAEHPELVTQKQNDEFVSKSYTIGGMIVFPGNQVTKGAWTINQARGCLKTIADRLDLTVECVRRHYLGVDDPSGLGKTLDRYRTFFALFGSFNGYVDFFLLQDVVSDDCSSVQFFMPFEDYRSSSVPKDLDTYLEFRRRSIEFVEARNRRMERYVIAAHR